MRESLQTQVQLLRETQPARYGLVRAHHADVRRAIEASSRNYPTTQQLLGTLENTDLSARMLGNVLSLFARFGVLAIHSERNNGNRYDLTAYDRGRMDELARLLEADSRR
ncbi:hypothetical protein [Halegenticoccus tardaugens]|uniref:hypothetical protein n=1 Tax=Halegenticoccus tardaugens TaxID=2071624 RepID=UPI00100A86AE|nr:hypothetical protein [Halegenticoccus tardaugens]